MKIPSTLQYVGAIGQTYVAENSGYTFLNCTSLKTIDFSAATELVRFGVQAFAGSGLESIVIPEGVDVISTSMFYGCENLKSVTLPSTILAINKSAINSERDFRKTQQKIPNKIENSLQMIA